jgi:hypothetical protein
MQYVGVFSLLKQCSAPQFCAARVHINQAKMSKNIELGKPEETKTAVNPFL